LNAVLRQYNIVADRGSENSRIYQKNGLVYRVLDHQGNKKGVPIKASACDSKPTLKLLQEKFQQNERTRQQHAVRVKNAIDWALFKGQEHTFHSFLKSLEKEGIVAIWKQKGAGVSQDITYIDHTTKCVFSGIGLGLRYSAPGIQSRCRQVKQLQPEQNILEQKIKRVEEEVDPIGHTIKSSQVLASKMVNKTDSCKHASPVEDQSHQQNKTVKKKRNHISRHL
jgi:hypothetical protein